MSVNEKEKAEQKKLRNQKRMNRRRKDLYIAKKNMKKYSNQVQTNNKLYFI